MRLSNISFRLFVILLLSSFLASPLFSSETRISTLGGGNIFIKDQANVFLFPSTILQYPDLVVTEMRAYENDAFYSIGTHLAFGDMVGGIYVNYPINSAAFTTAQANFLTGNVTRVNTGFAYLFGMPFGGMDLGLSLVGATTGREVNTDPKINESATYFAITAGASTSDFDVSAMIELPSLETKNITGRTDTSYGGFFLHTNARYNLMKLYGFNVVPVAKLSIGADEVDGGVASALFGFAVGVGLEKQINDDNLLIIGIEYGSSATATTIEAADGSDIITAVGKTILPGIYIGVESRIADWLIGRVGAQHENVKNETVTDPKATSDNIYYNSQFLVSLGLGMEFGNFLVDFAMNEGLLFDGPYALGGRTPNNTLASRISVTYNFGGENE